MSDSPRRDDGDLHAVMAGLVRDFPVQPVSVEAALAGVTRAAVELLDGIDDAGVLLIDGEHFQSVAPTGPIAAALDAIQLEHRQGPCLEAACADAVIRAPDLKSETRWPTFTAAALQHGVGGVVAFQLYTRASTGAGALSLLGRGPQQLTADQEAVAMMLATHAAVALTAANTAEQFHSALASRDHIGQAKGMLMHQYDIDAIQAFDLLRKLSQDQNVPLRDIAQKLIKKR